MVFNGRRVKKFISRKVSEFKKSSAERRAERKELERLEREALFEERKKSAVQVGRARAQVETKRRIKALQQPRGDLLGGEVSLGSSFFGQGKKGKKVDVVGGGNIFGGKSKGFNPLTGK